MSKGVARNMVLEWTPAGSTTVTTFSGQARNLEHGSTVDDADGTGYGDDNRQHFPTIKDEELTFDLFLDDTTYDVQNMFLAEEEGTLAYYPWGKAVGKEKITFPGYVNDASRSYPYDDMAMASISLLPTGNVVYGTHSA
jgi:hypothetical protein